MGKQLVNLIRVLTVLAIMFSSSAFGDVLYTSLHPDKCFRPSESVITAYAARGLDVQQCQAPKGWKVFVVATNERSWLDFQHDDHVWTTEDEVVNNSSFGFFPNVGEGVMEWNLTSSQAISSAIFRVYAQDNRKGASVDKAVTRLFVIGLRQNVARFCGTARTNEEARGIAAAGDKCTKLLPEKITAK